MSGRLFISALLIGSVVSMAGCGGPKISGGDNGGARPPGGGPTMGGGPGGGPGFTLPPAPAEPDGGAPTTMPTPPVAGESCAEEAHDGKLVPLDLLFLVDISGSMEEAAGAQSKWVATREALQTFVKDPMSTGLGAGLLFFPPPSKPCAMDGECGSRDCEQKGVCSVPAEVATTEPACTRGVCTNLAPCTIYGLCARTGLRCTAMGQACPGGPAGDLCMPRPKLCVDDQMASCQPATYENAVVPIGDLPGNVGMLDATLNATTPQGGTPTTPAVKGAIAQLRARAAANPGRKPVLVLATDGVPNGCIGNTADAASGILADAYMGTPSVSTYVIGVFRAAQLAARKLTLDMMAAAGGTGESFVLSVGNDLSQRFLQAINQIRGTALGCEFLIPPPSKGTIDFDRVNVRYSGPAGNEDLRYVASEDRCDPARGGWYYDVPPATGRPTRVRLCPATCGKVKDTAGVSIQLRFGCKSKVD
jgi:hypothetical protein